MIYTVGYAGRTIEGFIDTLKQYGIEILSDVRSSPWSKWTPDFGKEKLERYVADHHIRYYWMGDQLGARPDSPELYVKGRLSFALMRKQPYFHAGIARLRKGEKKWRIALMCAEKDPLDCHRFGLISRVLDEEGVSVSHILFDNSLEPHQKAMERLAKLEGLKEADLFMDKQERFIRACDRQEKRISYTVAESGEEYNKL